MKLFAPEYYKKFSCIADKCKHSCCIGWEIDIDDNTLGKYKNSNHAYAKDILASIDFSEMPHFRLGALEKCPHLDERGLCKIILNAGEDYLCHICREHPRFYNDGVEFREVGLGMACEEACRLILSSENYDTFVAIDDIDDFEPDFEPDFEFDSRLYRTKIYSILSDDSMGYNERLKSIYDEFSVSPTELNDTEWRKTLESLEYLDANHKSLFLEYSSALNEQKEYDDYLRRALAYFIFRHCTECFDEDEFVISLGFCLFCERLLASLIRFKEPKTFEDIVDLARILSEEIEYSEDNTYEIKLRFANIEIS